jgi:hypothetical protein
VETAVKERSMKILFARFDSAEDFLRHYDPVLEWGGIVVPTKAALPPSTPVVVEVAFPGLPNRVLVRGSLLLRKRQRRVQQRPRPQVMMAMRRRPKRRSRSQERSA